MSDLTAAIVRDALDYDPETGVFTWRHRVGRGLSGMVAGFIRKDGYREIRLQRRGYLAGRLAWFYMTGEWPRHSIDHRNHQRDDDRFENLRPATHSENITNMPVKKSNTSGVKGVKSSGCISKPWRAEIMKDRKRYFLGHFETKQDASDAYAAAAAALHGDFACLG